MLSDEEFQDILSQSAKELHSEIMELAKTTTTLSYEEAAYAIHDRDITNDMFERANNQLTESIEEKIFNNCKYGHGAFVLGHKSIPIVIPDMNINDGYGLMNIPVVDQFEMANIQLTKEQKDAITQCNIAFKGFSEAMITAMQGCSLVIGGIANSLMDCLKAQEEIIIKPEPSYTKKKKPWQRDRFYD